MLTKHEYGEDDFEKWSSHFFNAHPRPTHIGGEEWARAAWAAAWTASRDNTMQQLAWEESERDV